MLVIYVGFWATCSHGLVNENVAGESGFIFNTLEVIFLFRFAGSNH